VEYVFSRAVLEGTELLSGGSIDLAYVTYASGATASLDPSTDVLTVTAGATSTQVQMLGDYTGEQFLVTPNTVSEARITVGVVPCFRAGTLILTTQGEVLVEQLSVGDEVVVHDGAVRPLRWIGRRHIFVRRHTSPEAILPVRIAAHAFGPFKPHRDLFLSPDHSVFFEDVLIPIRHLINDTTVRQVSVPEVTYFHLELERHDVVLANGLLAESYLDTGDRISFENDSRGTALHPSFGIERHDPSLIIEAAGYAPLRVTGPEVERARAALAKADFRRLEHATVA
jgi:hypothetical protein